MFAGKGPPEFAISSLHASGVILKIDISIWDPCTHLGLSCLCSWHRSNAMGEGSSNGGNCWFDVTARATNGVALRREGKGGKRWASTFHSASLRFVRNAHCYNNQWVWRHSTVRLYVLQHFRENDAKKKKGAPMKEFFIHLQLFRHFHIAYRFLLLPIYTVKCYRTISGDLFFEIKALLPTCFRKLRLIIIV